MGTSAKGNNPSPVKGEGKDVCSTTANQQTDTHFPLNTVKGIEDAHKGAHTCLKKEKMITLYKRSDIVLMSMSHFH